MGFSTETYIFISWHADVQVTAYTIFLSSNDWRHTMLNICHLMMAQYWNLCSHSIHALLYVHLRLLNQCWCCRWWVQTTCGSNPNVLQKFTAVSALQNCHSVYLTMICKSTSIAWSRRPHYLRALVGFQTASLSALLTLFSARLGPDGFRFVLARYWAYQVVAVVLISCSCSFRLAWPIILFVKN